jgi:hypothetical protein
MRSMMKGLMQRVGNQWPIVTVVVAGALTVAWAALLLWALVSGVMYLGAWAGP